MSKIFHHGVRVHQSTEGARTIRTVNTGIIGIAITAPKGPVNVPVLIAGSRTKAATTFGDTIGTANRVFNEIFNQVGAIVVAVNVLDPAVHNAAVVAKEYTLDATTESLTLDHKYSQNEVVQNQATTTTYTLNTDYTIDNDTGKLSRVTTGSIVNGETLNIGYDIPDATAVTAADVVGTIDAGTGQHKGLKALLVAESQLGVKPRILGAPYLDEQTVATELHTIADALRAFSYVYAWGAETSEAAITYRENFGTRRTMVLWPNFTADDGSAEVSSVAIALGLRAKIDNDIGWHKTISTVAVNGVTGISKDVPWSLQNPNTIAGLLNASEVTTLKQSGGFKFHGNRTCATDQNYAFESAVRTDDILADTIAEAHEWMLDKPMSRKLIDDALEGINAKIRSLTANGYLMGGKAWIDPDKNTTTTLGAGELNISYEFTPVPPAENINFHQTLTNDYLIKLVA